MSVPILCLLVSECELEDLGTSRLEALINDMLLSSKRFSSSFCCVAALLILICKYRRGIAVAVRAIGLMCSITCCTTMFVVWLPNIAAVLPS